MIMQKLKLLLFKKPYLFILLQVIYVIVLQYVLIYYSKGTIVYDPRIMPPCCLAFLDEEFEYPVYEVTLVIDSNDHVRQIESTMIRQPYYPIYIPETSTDLEELISDSGSTLSEAAVSESSLGLGDSSDTSSNPPDFREMFYNNFRSLLNGLSPTEKAKAINSDFFQQIRDYRGERETVSHSELSLIVHDILSGSDIKDIWAQPHDVATLMSKNNPSIAMMMMDINFAVMKNQTGIDLEIIRHLNTQISLFNVAYLKNVDPISFIENISRYKSQYQTNVIPTNPYL